MQYIFHLHHVADENIRNKPRKDINRSFQNENDLDVLPNKKSERTESNNEKSGRTAKISDSPVNRKSGVSENTVNESKGITRGFERKKKEMQGVDGSEMLNITSKNPDYRRKGKLSKNYSTERGRSEDVDSETSSCETEISVDSIEGK